LVDEVSIGYAHAGGLPFRKNKKIGLKISKGWTNENEWEGYLNASEKFSILNPERGFIVTANN